MVTQKTHRDKTRQEKIDDENQLDLERAIRLAPFDVDPADPHRPLPGTEVEPEYVRPLQDTRLDPNGREIPSPLPIAPPVGYRPEISMVDRLRQQIRNEMSLYAAANEFETFEEADDFDVGEDDEPFSPYELAELDGQPPQTNPATTVKPEPTTASSDNPPPSEDAPAATDPKQ